MMFGITAADLRAFLGYTDGSRDALIDMFLNAGFKTMQELLGRKLERAVYKDTFQFKSPRHFVREYPIQEIEFVKVGETEVPTTEYALFKEAGYIHFKTWYYQLTTTPMVVEPSEYLTIQYVGGYEELPADMMLALYNAVQAADNFNKQSAQFGGPVKRLSVYDVGVTDLAVPRDGMLGAMRASLADGLKPYIEMHQSLGGWVVKESERISTYTGSP
jgi:hypothetical protein